MKKKMYKNLENVAQKFTALMIERIRQIDNDWTKPWFPVKRKNFYPRNLSGRRYSGGNTIMLLIYLIFNPYRTPVFLTYRQAEELGLKVSKGAFPVYHFTYIYLHRVTRDKISEKEYRQLSKVEQDEYGKYPIAKYYNVFNLDQTDYAEKYPQQWEELLNHYSEKVQLNEGEMFTHPFLDDIFENQKWVCPIEFLLSNRAFYSPPKDTICIPLKQQFKNGEEFYTTSMHEMAHSTGAETRLKRKFGVSFSPEYAKEELIAELSSALMGYFMGIEATIREDHAAYLKHWIGQLDAEPDFLLDVLSDTVKAVNYMMEQMGYELPEEISITTNAGNPEKVKEIIQSKEEEVMVFD